jgi:hypothetical protein
MMKNVPVHEAATRGKNTTHQQLEARTPPTASDVCLNIKDTRVQHVSATVIDRTLRGPALK